MKICSSSICMKTAFCGGVLEKDSQHIYKIRAIEKTSSTYIHKIGVLATLLREMFTKLLSCKLSSHLIATEKRKPHSPLKNFPHLYEKNRGFGTPFLRLSITYLQFVYRNRPCTQKLCHRGRSRPQNEVLILALKNIPHLIGQKMGKIHPSLRIVYFLFTKIDRANKKCAFRRIKIGLGVFYPDP